MTKPANQSKPETDRDSLWEDMIRASRALKSFPRGRMGLTPDAVKASLEWKTAKHEYETALARYRSLPAKTKGCP